MMKATTSSPSAKRSVAVFRSISEANRWLSRRSSIVILNLRVEYRNTLYPTSHTFLRRIIIDYVSYPQTVNITYGIDKSVYLSRHRATELQAHARCWAVKNYHREFVLCERNTSRLYRSKDGVLQDSLIRSTFITLYKTEKSDLQQVF
jgi:hypothetical protein